VVAETGAVVHIGISRSAGGSGAFGPGNAVIDEASSDRGMTISDVVVGAHVLFNATANLDNTSISASHFAFYADVGGAITAEAASKGSIKALAERSTSQTSAVASLLSRLATTLRPRMVLRPV
jgi:hypothetical protein